MKKATIKTLSVLLTAAIVCSAMCAISLTVSAQSNGSCGDNLTWTLEDGTLTISGTGEMWNFSYRQNPWYSQIRKIKNIIIPGTVTSIGGYAFQDCVRLSSITIPKGITSIEEYAFSGCSLLRDITISEGVTRIGDNTFYNCDALVNINIPGSVTSIGDCTFYNCRRLASINIPDSVTSIGDYTFYYCDALRNINIPDSVTSIGDYTFYYCDALANINIPDSVTSIGDHTFYNCRKLVNINIPDNLTSIGNNAFQGCHALTGITIPSSVTSIGNYAFSNCIALNNITIPNGITNIGNYAFNSCYALTDIVIPNGVTNIGEWAFGNCSSLKAITIPSSVTSIGNNAFFANNLTVYGLSGSYAQTYAKNNDIPFVSGIIIGDKFFTDVKPGEWYVDAVKYAVENNLFSGVSENEFAPGTAMTRAMLVKVLYNLEGNPKLSDDTVNPFEDVKDGEWYTDAVKWAAENGVVYGTSETEFSPNDNITREQLSTILFRYSKIKRYDVSVSKELSAFTDGENVENYALEAVSWAIGAGLITGNEINSKIMLDPKGSATRAQVALILKRYDALTK